MYHNVVSERELTKGAASPRAAARESLPLLKFCSGCAASAESGVVECSINQYFIFSVKQNVTEYIGEYKNTHMKIYKNRTAKPTVLE